MRTFVAKEKNIILKVIITKEKKNFTILIILVTKEKVLKVVILEY